MKKFLPLILLIAFSAQAQTKLQLSRPPQSAALAFQGVINTGMSERDFALSPDGNEIFYTLQSPQGVFQTILYIKKDKKGNWSQPIVAPFAGKYSDLEPAFSFDGTRLYFSSNRPLEGNKAKDFDIWVVEKQNEVWGIPVNIGLPVNTPADEFYPSVAKSGNLYYTAAYTTNAIGKEDIYCAKWENGKYASPSPLDTAVNSKTYEFNAFVSPEEDYIIFTSYGRKDDMGRGDLYMSIKGNDGKWKPAKNIKSINSNKLDYCPFVSFDKKALFFTSERHTLKDSYPEKPVDIKDLLKTFTSPQNGGGDIYWVDFEQVLTELSK